MNNDIKSADVLPIIGRYYKYPLNNRFCRIAEGGKRIKGTVQTNMNGLPLVSIITVVFNRKDKLERAINSILTQTYPNIEYIVVDGGSKDGTLDIIKKYEDNIDYYISEEDAGIYNAMNKGLELVSGEYIGILNSDDWFETDAVEKSINQIQKTGADYSGAISTYIDKDGKEVYKFLPQYFDEVAIFSLQPCGHATMFISKNSYEKVGLYDEKYKIVADLKMQFLLIKNNFKYCTLNESIHNFETEGVSSKRVDKTISELTQLLPEINGFISDELAESIIYLTWNLPFNKKRYEDILTILKNTKFNAKQKEFVKNKLIEKYGWQVNNGLLVEGPNMFYKLPVIIEEEKKCEQFCGKFEFYPVTSQRYFEAGLRVKGIKKPFIDDNEPLVSIITVVYNNKEKIERAMNSVFNQSYKNIEYIIIDGGSNDGTVNIIEKYFDRIDYFISEADKGIYDAINKGISLSSGKYIGILNSDDWYTPDAVKESIEKVLESNADYSGADEIIVDENENYIRNYGISYFDEVAYFSLNPCNHGSMFISREVYNAIGPYDTNYKIASDLKYQLSIIKKGFKPCIINKAIHYYELSGISFQQQGLSVNEVLDILKEFHPNLDNDDILKIVRFRYFDELNVETLRMYSNVLQDSYYTKAQKEYLYNKFYNKFGHTLYLYHEISNKKPDYKDIPGKVLSKLLLVKMKTKISKKLNGTILYIPFKLLYTLFKKLITKIR